MSGSPVQIRTVTVDAGINIFYRTAGDPANPTILLLHGFPSSSHQFRDLIPQISSHHHIIAPDLPGFGFTTVPDSVRYDYTFAGLTKTMLQFIDALSLVIFAMYVFDYGAPVGFRIALERPHGIKAIISQNGNVYKEGLGTAFWAPISQLWQSDTPAQRNVLEQSLLSFAATKFQYENGVADPTLLAQIPPESYQLDYALLQRPGQVNIQLGLFKDYQSNVDLYPKFQEFLRTSNVSVLAIWGKNDVIFVKEGAEAFRKDVDDLEVDLLDTGHFALETHGARIAGSIRGFLGERWPN